MLHVEYRLQNNLNLLQNNLNLPGKLSIASEFAVDFHPVVAIEHCIDTVKRTPILAAGTYFIYARTGNGNGNGNGKLQFLPGLIIGLSAIDVRGSLLIGFTQAAAID